MSDNDLTPITVPVEEEIDDVALGSEELASAQAEAEAYTKSIKTDDFVVPANFQEFIERYPKYIFSFLIRKKCPQELLEEFQQEMCLYMLSVSKNGRAKGITDRIVSFNGDKIGGASAGKFFAYINLLLLRKWMVLIERRCREPITQRQTISIQTITEDNSNEFIPGSMTEEDIMLSSSLSLVDVEEIMRNKSFVSGFISFLKRNEPVMVGGAFLFMKYNSLPEISRSEGISIEDVNRLRNRLRILATVYQRGMTKIPNKRKTYNKRKVNG